MILFSKAVEGYLLHAEARSLSKFTIRDYTATFERFIQFNGDVPVDKITKQDIEAFLKSLTGISNKTKLNYHIGLSAMWTWLNEERLVKEHIVRRVKRPKAQTAPIHPFNEKDIKLLLASVERSKPYRRFGQLEPCSHSNPQAVRNKTMIYLMLDTGIRLAELCSLKIKDVDIRNRELEIRKGKGKKKRFVYFSSKTGKALWLYMASRPGAGDLDPLFATKEGLPLTGRAVEAVFTRLGKSAGVKNVHPHRFRHTFAITYLRNGGDGFTLQKILGHSDMTMTRRYLDLAKEDLKDRHLTASPVANWNI